jgi:hypothetical protein
MELTKSSGMTVAALSASNPDMRGTNASTVIPKSAVFCIMLDAAAAK